MSIYLLVLNLKQFVEYLKFIVSDVNPASNWNIAKTAQEKHDLGQEYDEFWCWSNIMARKYQI